MPTHLILNLLEVGPFTDYLLCNLLLDICKKKNSFKSVGLRLLSLVDKIIRNLFFDQVLLDHTQYACGVRPVTATCAGRAHRKPAQPSAPFRQHGYHSAFGDAYFNAYLVHIFTL
jgi:hypothetical protein